MKNDPHNRNMAPRVRTPTPEPRQETADSNEIKENGVTEETGNDTESDIYKLPPPEPLLLVNGVETKIRIPPKNQTSLDKDFDINKVGSSRIFTFHRLFD